MDGVRGILGCQAVTAVKMWIMRGVACLRLLGAFGMRLMRLVYALAMGMG